ncbi:MAG: exopolysaccharide biosynthesis protein [Planctomycetes bacterium]|nr:exopolysaccharide biosynthesis protein [Planctomycetota bacterium]
MQVDERPASAVPTGTGGMQTNSCSSRPDESRLRHSLRLSSILAQLAADQPTIVEEEPVPTDRKGRRGSQSAKSNLTIGEIVDRTAQAGFGFFIGLLAIVSIPFVGLSTPFGLTIVVGAVQMIFGLDRPWLPRVIRRRLVSLRVLRALSDRVARWTAGVERIIRPRFEFMTYGPLWALCGVCISIQAFGLALPLPIPGSNWPFIFVIVLYSIGILERDGLLLMVAHTLTVAEIALAIASWDKLVEALHKAYGWIVAIT